jgi:hypothetical protein
MDNNNEKKNLERQENQFFFCTSLGLRDCVFTKTKNEEEEISLLFMSFVVSRVIQSALTADGLSQPCATNENNNNNTPETSFNKRKVT